jgi:ankyrin repeat protein
MAQAAGTSAPLRTYKSSPAVVNPVAGGISPPRARVTSRSERDHGSFASQVPANHSASTSASTTTATGGTEARVFSPAELLINALRSEDKKEFDQVFKNIKRAASQEAKAANKPSHMQRFLAEKINAVGQVFEATWGPTTPLIAAVRGKKLHCLNLLLAAGANPNLLAGESGLALMFAKDPEYAKALLEAGADPNLVCPHNGSVLNHAASAGWDLKVIQALLDHKANVNLLATNPPVALSIDILSQCWHFVGRTKELHLAPKSSPLMAAASSGNVSILNLLIQAGADLECKGGPKDYTALMLAVTAKMPDAVQALLAAGSNVAALDKDGNTPLHLASIRGFHEIMEKLIKAGAAVDTLNAEGKTALMIVQDGLVSPTWAAEERLKAAKKVLLDAESLPGAKSNRSLQD